MITVVNVVRASPMGARDGGNGAAPGAPARISTDDGAFPPLNSNISTHLAAAPSLALSARRDRLLPTPSQSAAILHPAHGRENNEIQPGTEAFAL